VAKYDQVIKRCGGGEVRFGLTGQSVSVYATKFQLCLSAFQDARYGQGQRLHNPCVKDGAVWHRCTVCGQGHGVCRI
jgi:hypothetical protein